MTTLVLAFTVAVAMPNAKFTMCWMPASGVAVYEVREAVVGGKGWTPYRWNMTCVANTPCCVDGTAWHSPVETNTYYDYRDWIVLGYTDPKMAGNHTAQSAPMTVNYNVVGRTTSDAIPATITPPTLQEVATP